MSIKKRILLFMILMITMITAFNNHFYKVDTSINTFVNNSQGKENLYLYNVDEIYSKVPVLLYHSISETKKDIFTVTKKDFEKQMRFLREHNYNVLNLNEYVEFIQGKHSIPENSVLITFDDGYEDNYKYAYPILKKYDFPAVIFIITDKIDQNNYYMSSQQLKEISKNKIDIQSHTSGHQHLIVHSYDTQLQILQKSKTALEKILGKRINFIAYPYGQYDSKTVYAAKKVGYTMGFSATDNIFGRKIDIYGVHRVYVTGFTRMREFKKIIYYNRNIIR